MRLYDEGVRGVAAIVSVQLPNYRGRFVFHEHSVSRFDALQDVKPAHRMLTSN
jgi:hypothetical protein